MKSRKNFIERQILKEILDNNDINTISDLGVIKYKGRDYRVTQKITSLDSAYHGPNIQIKTLIANIKNNPPNSSPEVYFSPSNFKSASSTPSTPSTTSTTPEMTLDEFRRTISDFFKEGKSLTKQDEIMNEEFKKKYGVDVIHETEMTYFSAPKEIEPEPPKFREPEKFEEDLNAQYFNNELFNDPLLDEILQKKEPLTRPEIEYLEHIFNEIRKFNTAVKTGEDKYEMKINETAQEKMAEISKKFDQYYQLADKYGGSVKNIPDEELKKITSQEEIEKREDWKNEKENDELIQQKEKDPRKQKLLEILEGNTRGIINKAIKDPNFSFDDLPDHVKVVFKEAEYLYGNDPDFEQFKIDSIKKSIGDVREELKKYPEDTQTYLKKKSAENLKESFSKVKDEEFKNTFLKDPKIEEILKKQEITDQEKEYLQKAFNYYKPYLTTDVPSNIKLNEIDTKLKNISSSKQTMQDVKIPPKIVDEKQKPSEIEKKAGYTQGSGLAGAALDKIPLPGGPVGTLAKWTLKAGAGELEKSLISGESPLAEFLSNKVPGRDQSAGDIMKNQGFEGSKQDNIVDSFATENSPPIDTKIDPVFKFDIADFLGEDTQEKEKTSDTSYKIGTESAPIGHSDKNKGSASTDPNNSQDDVADPEIYSSNGEEEKADDSFNNFSQPGTYVGTIPPAPEGNENSNAMIENQVPSNLSSDQEGNQKKLDTYRNAIHKNALIVYFGSYERPNWDWNLWQAYNGTDLGQNKLYFLGISRSLFALHGTDLLIDDLVYNENSSPKEVFQEYMEVIQLYKCFAGICGCSCSSSEDDMVKIPKQDFNSVLSTLSSGQLPRLGGRVSSEPIQDITSGIKSGKLSKKDAMEKLKKMIAFKKQKVDFTKQIEKDQFMDKSILNTISNYELKQMQPTDIPRQHRKMWNGVPQIYNPIKIQQISDRVGLRSITAIDNLNKGQIIMSKPNSIYVPAKGETKKMHLRIEIPKE